jgi:asparagine synthase (glutamine-hydrolysing)
MCGIAGLLRLDGATVDPDALRALVDPLIHRGPDGEGHHVDGPLGFGMRRLSIIDLQTGDQPIANEDGQVWVVFNGEIYNYRELRADLERRGHHFATRTDTEVLVHLYEEAGPGLLEQLRGMFAFALWDARARRLLLARDRAGKKPLYYAHLGDRLVFGSEIKALLADPSVPGDLDPTALYHYLCLGFVPHPRSIYRAIRALPPAHYLIAEPSGAVRVERYWELKFAPKHTCGLRAIDEGIETLLGEAVRLRLRSDVPVGVFLSGGIDSGLVTAAAARASDEPLRTFAVGFEGQANPELALARQVAARYGTRHEEVVLDLAAEARQLPALLTALDHAYDEPYADSSAIPSYFVARAARAHVKVVLNGDGGDEAFAGYRRYTAALLLGPVNATLGPAARLLGRRVPAPQQRRGAVAWSLRLLEAAGLPPAERFLRWSALRTDAEAQRLCTPGLLEGVEETATELAARCLAQCRAAGAWGPVDTLQAMDFNLVLPDDLLVKMDRATMANSLEARSPLLDHRLLEFAARVPEWLRASPLTTKPLLRRLARRWLPAGVVEAPKRGFEIPLAHWFRGDLRPEITERLANPASPLAPLVCTAEVTRLLDEHLAGRRDHAWPLWSLLVLDHWLRERGAGL